MGFSDAPPPPSLKAKKMFCICEPLHFNPQFKTEHTSKSNLQHARLPCKSAPKDTVTTSWKPRNTRTVIFIGGWIRDRRSEARTVNAQTLITLTGWALKLSQLRLAQRETRKLGNQYTTSASWSATLGGRGNDMSLGFQLWPSFPDEIWTLPSGVSPFELNSLMGKVVLFFLVVLLCSVHFCETPGSCRSKLCNCNTITLVSYRKTWFWLLFCFI